MAYQEGQYISQFMNTLPQQLLSHSQFQESQRQFDVSSRERERQFDALQGLRESAEARTAEQYEYGKEQRTLLDLLLQKQRARSVDIAESKARRDKALEERSFGEKIYTGMGELGIPWTENEMDWANRVTGLDPWDEKFKAMDIPEGLQLTPEMYQYITQLSGYNAPHQNLLNLISGGK